MNKILNGDALVHLKELPEKSINMCMTSPPYWALRDYGSTVETIWENDKFQKDWICEHEWGFELKIKGHQHWRNFEWKTGGQPKEKESEKVQELSKGNFCKKCQAWKGQLGLEPTFDLYIKHLCDIFDEVKRVLRDDGTCWVNIGDTYGGSGNASGHTEDTKNLGYITSQMGATKGMTQGLMPKSLVMIPFRFSIEMVNRGWILRNTIIWYKRNCMPSSIKDRFTVDFEYLFFFSKKKKYYFEQQLDKTITKDNIIRDRDTTKLNNTPGRTRMGGLDRNDYDFKNKRTVWIINPKPFKEAHFAVYPEELCETPIKAGCPEFVCIECGNPKIKIYEGTSNQAFNIRVRDVKEGRIKHLDRRASLKETQNYKEGKSHVGEGRKFIGYKPTCVCNAEFIGGIVLDPFFGAGTTGIVALKQNKNFIGIELSREYIEIAKARLKPYLEQRKLK